MSQPEIKTALLNWNEQGTPVSREFGDVYFSNDSGLEETRHVFLRGNHLPQRFYPYSGAQFTIAETGFGTGLNFLTVWQEWQQFRQQATDNQLKRLHFISFEKHPLQRDDLIAAHRAWPELAPFTEQLQQQWPVASAGCHRLYFADSQIILDLWFGDVNQLLPELDRSYYGKIDAWFLDGFAPSKNPDMWSETLFSYMAILSRQQGTFATYTAAGFVRRGLIQAGFEVCKQVGFGSKREMLTGVLPVSVPQHHSTPWYARPAANHVDDIAIVGGGIAAICTALALLERGAKVTLYCADQQAGQGASGNQQGALYPLLNGNDDLLTPFYCQAFSFARRYYDRLAKAGVDFPHQWCGVTQFAYDQKSRRKMSAILSQQPPKTLAYSADAKQLSQLCGLAVPHDGLHYPLGGWLCPVEFTQAAIRYGQTLGMQVCYQYQLVDLEYQSQQWQLHFANHQQATHPTVILAMGHQLTTLKQTATLPLHPVRGQVSHIPTTPLLSQLRQVLCYDGYLTPVDPVNHTHCLGASYLRGHSHTDYSEQEQQQNRQRLIDCLSANHDAQHLSPQSLTGESVNWGYQVDVSGQQARCGVRSTMRDYLPLVGAAPRHQATVDAYTHVNLRKTAIADIPAAPSWPNLFILGGLGSRGLCSAPLLAETLASQIYGEPLPLSAKLLAGLHTHRTWVNKLRKGWVR